MEVVRRKACRAVLLTPANEALLIRIENPDGGWSGWITPGGGIDPGGDEATALKRELFEELGLTEFKMGPKIWHRSHRFPWKQRLIEQEEVFFLLKVNRFEVQSMLNPDSSERMDLKEFRWWPFEEIASSAEKFSPRNFPTLLRHIIFSGPSGDAVDVGV